jgi:hypothetical protein
VLLWFGGAVDRGERAEIVRILRSGELRARLAGRDPLVEQELRDEDRSGF